jgi:hypothetical protein
MKQNKQMYVAPKVELIAMELQGVLCSSVPESAGFNGTGLNIEDQFGTGAWVL